MMLTREAAAPAGGDYLTQHVDAKSAARVLAISRSRFQQLTGTRQEPGRLGAGEIVAGRRGARWSLRAVLQYALDEDRDLAFPLPPLLPYSNGAARYEPVGARSWVAEDATHLQIHSRHAAASVTAWAQFMVPKQAFRCGQEQPSVLLLTPTWPTTRFDLRSPILDVLAQALQQPGWADFISPSAGLSVVLLRSGADRERLTHAGTVDVLEVPAQLLTDLTQALRDGPATVDLDRLGHWLWYEVPATDAASCLGVAALPWWPEGCASAGTCGRWAPGQPVTITAPASHAASFEVRRWLLHHAPAEGSAPASGPTRDDYLYLARLIDPTLNYVDANRRSPDLPDGLELAVNIRWPDPVPQPANTQDLKPWWVLDQLYADPDVPIRVARTLHGYFGDPAYTHPVHLSLDRVPVAWRAALTEYLDRRPTETAIGSHRWQLLHEQHQEHLETNRWAEDPGLAPGGSSAPERAALRSVRVGPLESPAVFDGASVTWLAPTGYNSDGKDDPAAAVPAGAAEAWFARDELTTNHTRGWIRTLDEEFAPVPAKSQAIQGDIGDAAVLRAIAHRIDPGDLLTGNEAFNDHEILRLLKAARATSAPDPISWEELMAIAATEHG